MKQTFKNLETGDEVEISPGKSKVQNTDSGAFVELTATMLKVQTGVSQFIKITFENGIEMQDGTNTLKLSLSGGLEISDGTGATTALSLLQLLHNNGAGKTNSVTDEQVVLSDSSNITTIAANQTVVQSASGMESTLSPAQLYLDNGSGKTNSITDEQMVINGSSKTAVYEVTGVSLTQASASLGLTITDGLVIENDGSTLTASPFGVDLDDGSGHTALLSSTSGLDLSDGSGGTVNIEVQSGETISFQATEGCDVDEGGEPITTMAKVLRGAATPA